ncbi:integral peroxisomal membrane peroxin-domain-containing protein [Coniochaeta sp. 2T2.1]|nr:integral peroxisomal membrane peroxin-domain-containing protein [Coniochaeta sp. 2T2.1]
MAAFETPWVLDSHMSTPRSQRSDPLDSSSHPTTTPSKPSYNYDASSSTPQGNAPPTYATFSPTTLSATTPSASTAAKRRSTILVHQKSPLLLATPPQITRALAYSHPFLLPLNKLVGLLSWTTGDPWESFLLVVAFWATVLYGDVVIRVAGPVVLVLLLIGGMYGRRYSPLSSSGWSEPGLGTADGSALSAADAAKAKRAGKQKNLSVDSTSDTRSLNNNNNEGNTNNGQGGHSRARSHSTALSAAEATSTRHQKTLDEIVKTLKEFTGRCNILLEPMLELTDFLSTQRTPTSATTRPALTTLFVRILLCTPFWYALTLGPWRIVTTRRVMLVFGTVVLTWHSRVMRVSRVILWRSATVRRGCALVTGLRFETPKAAGVREGKIAAGAATVASKSGDVKANGAVKQPQQRESELTKALRRAKSGRDAGVRFTFIIYENQRRWVGLGWTNSLFAYERAAWTDEHNNPVPAKDEFELPEVEDGSNMRWMWVEGSRWRVDGVGDEAAKGEEGEVDYDGPGGRMGWVYYDNKWQNGRRGQDGWGRWTRRRKWYRDAELVEVEEDDVSSGAAPGSAEATINTTEPDDSTPSAQAQFDGASTSTSSSSPKPALPPRRPSLSSHALSPTPASLSTASVSIPSSNNNNNSLHHHPHPEEGETSTDSASILSSSSRSTSRFGGPSSINSNSGKGGPPTLRRRATDASSRKGKGGRRASDAVEEEEEAAVLGTSLGLGNRSDGGGDGGWGVGDEVRMGLE